MTAIRDPALIGAEVAWRWSYGAAATVLAIVAFAGFLDSLTVTDRDLLALGSRNQDLVTAALAHIFQDAGPGLLRASIFLIPALALLWIAAASMGRMATLRALIQTPTARGWPSMLVLHFARVVGVLVALVFGLGIMVIAAWISSSPDAEGFVRPDESLYILILLLTLPALGLFWSYLNSILSLAPLFVVRNQASATRSIALAARVFRERRTDLWGVTALFGILRVMVWGALLVGSLFVVTTLSTAGFRITLTALILLSLAYFLVADFLYIARLAAVVEICGDDAPPERVALHAGSPPQPIVSPAVQASTT